MLDVRDVDVREVLLVVMVVVSVFVVTVVLVVVPWWRGWTSIKNRFCLLTQQRNKCLENASDRLSSISLDKVGLPLRCAQLCLQETDWRCDCGDRLCCEGRRESSWSFVLSCWDAPSPSHWSMLLSNESEAKIGSQLAQKRQSVNLVKLSAKASQT